jgi:Mrp family chromosome partitioning ATPase
VSDALVLAPLSDGTLFVADAGKTTKSAIRHARQQLDQVGARTVGAVLNNYDPGSAKYYGSDGYSYSSAYRYEESPAEQHIHGNGKRPSDAGVQRASDERSDSV